GYLRQTDGQHRFGRAGSRVHSPEPKSIKPFIPYAIILNTASALDQLNPIKKAGRVSVPHPLFGVIVVLKLLRAFCAGLLPRATQFPTALKLSHHPEWWV